MGGRPQWEGSARAGGSVRSLSSRARRGLSRRPCELRLAGSVLRAPHLRRAYRGTAGSHGAALRCHPEDPRLFQESRRVPSFPSRVQDGRAALTQGPAVSSWAAAQGAAPAEVGALQSPECPQVKQSTGCPEAPRPRVLGQLPALVPLQTGSGSADARRAPASSRTNALNTLGGERTQQQLKLEALEDPEPGLGRPPSPTPSRQAWAAPLCAGRLCPRGNACRPARLPGVPPVK